MSTSQENTIDATAQKRVLTPEVKLERLYSRLSNDQRFEHLRYQQKMIPGNGVVSNPLAMILIEMPEANDANIGVPLTGPGGILLGEMLQVADLKRASHTYVTSVLKWRPRVMREATQFETAVSLPYLEEEINIVNPQYIVACGRYVNHLFFPRRHLVDITGEIMVWKKRWYVMPTLNPVQAANDPAKRREMLKTFRMLGELA